MPRRNSKQLTDPGIAKMRPAPAGKRIERFDAGVDGLSLRLTDKGSKTWSVSYHLNARHQRLTLGPWLNPSDPADGALGVARAREEARKIKAWVKAELDPKVARSNEEQRAKQEAITEAEGRILFSTVAENYIQQRCEGRTGKPAPLARGAEIASLIRRELLPTWKDRPIASIKRLHLTELVDLLIVAGKPMAAHRLFETVKRLFNWAVDRGELDASPFAAMRAPVAKESRDRVLVDDEIRAIWSACDHTGYPFGPLVQLALVTGQRRSEVAGMRWGEVDLAGKTWTIPKARSKSKRAHIVPLSDIAITILETLPKYDHGDHVFTTTSGERPVSGFSKMKTRLDKTIAKVLDGKAIEGWRLHDLRRTCRTGLARLGVAEIIAERVLNHLPRGLSKVYNIHAYEEEKRKALDLWAAEIRTLTTPPPANVVDIKRRA